MRPQSWLDSNKYYLFMCAFTACSWRWPTSRTYWQVLVVEKKRKILKNDEYNSPLQTHFSDWFVVTWSFHLSCSVTRKGVWQHKLSRSRSGWLYLVGQMFNIMHSIPNNWSTTDSLKIKVSKIKSLPAWTESFSWCLIGSLIWTTNQDPRLAS